MDSPPVGASAAHLDAFGSVGARARAATTGEMADVLEEARPRLMALAYSVLRDRELAADAVQDTMERAVRFWSTLKSPTSRGAWLAAICMRQSLRLRRKEVVLSWLRFPRSEVSVDLVTSDVDLERAVAKLPARQRAILALHYSYGFTLDESAGVLGVRPGTARSHLARALSALREAMEP